MPADPRVVQPPGRRSLALLAEDMQVARDVVGEFRRAPIVRDRLLAARQCLVRAMESYAAELTAQGLPIPRKLHADLRLQRDIGRQRDHLG